MNMDLETLCLKAFSDSFIPILLKSRGSLMMVWDMQCCNLVRFCYGHFKRLIELRVKYSKSWIHFSKDKTHLKTSFGFN